MAKTHSATGTLIPILRDDGTVYFHESKTINQRLCEWTLALLWLLVVAVIVATLLWS